MYTNNNTFVIISLLINFCLFLNPFDEFQIRIIHHQKRHHWYSKLSFNRKRFHFQSVNWSTWTFQKKPSRIRLFFTKLPIWQLYARIDYCLQVDFYTIRNGDSMIKLYVQVYTIITSSFFLLLLSLSLSSHTSSSF